MQVLRWVNGYSIDPFFKIRRRFKKNTIFAKSEKKSKTNKNGISTNLLFNIQQTWEVRKGELKMCLSWTDQKKLGP